MCKYISKIRWLDNLNNDICNQIEGPVGGGSV